MWSNNLSVCVKIKFSFFYFIQQTPVWSHVSPLKIKNSQDPPFVRVGVVEIDIPIVLFEI